MIFRSVINVFALGFIGFALFSFLAVVQADEECEGNCNQTVVVGGNGVPTMPNIGRCMWQGGGASRWQCVAHYPVKEDPWYRPYRNCQKDTTQTNALCLREWADRSGWRICGTVIPGTDMVEVPYNHLTDQKEIDRQCGSL